MPTATITVTARQGVYFYELGGGINTIRMTAPITLGSSITLTLPPNTGSANQFLHTNGAGLLTWLTPNHLTLTNLIGGQYTDGGHTFLAQLTSSSINPTIFNDITAYKVGTIWTNITNSQPFICSSNAAGAAIWRKVIWDGIANVGIGQAFNSYALAVTGDSNFTGNVRVNTNNIVMDSLTGNITTLGSFTIYGVTPSSTQWSYFANANQQLATSDNPSFNQIRISGSTGNCSSAGAWLRWNTGGTGGTRLVNNVGPGTGGMYFDETSGLGTVVTPIACFTSNRLNGEQNTALGNTFNPALQASRYSIFVGPGAGANVNTLNASYETSRILIGAGAGGNVTSCQGCVCLGPWAGYGGVFATGGYDNTWIGTYSGYSVTTGIENSGLGKSTGRAVTTGSYNSFIGTFAGITVTTGNGNTFLGHYAGNVCTTGSSNTLIGDDVLCAASSTAGAVGLGSNFTVSTNSVGIAVAALTTVPTNNVIIGNASHEMMTLNIGGGLTPCLCVVKDGSNGIQFNFSTANPYIYHYANTRTAVETVLLQSYNSSLLDGDEYYFRWGVGTIAGKSAVMEFALGTAAAAYTNTYIGLGIYGNDDILKIYNDDRVITHAWIIAGTELQAKGYSAWDTSATVNQGTHIRWNVLGASETQIINHKSTGVGGIYFDETSGNGATTTHLGCITDQGNAAFCNAFTPATQASKYSIYIGLEAGKNINNLNGTYDTSRVLVGAGACYSASAANGCVCIGPNAGYGVAATTGGSYNAWVGTGAGYGVTTGSNNAALGTNAGYATTTGSNNVYAGLNSGDSNSTGSYNVYVGRNAGHLGQIGDYNVLLGNDVVCAAAGTNRAVGIGNSFSVGTYGIGIGSTESVAANTVVVGSTNTSTTKHWAVSHFDIYKDASNIFQFYGDSTAPFINHTSNARTAATTSLLRSLDTGLVDGDRYLAEFGHSLASGLAATASFVRGTLAASYTDSYIGLGTYGNNDALKVYRDGRITSSAWVVATTELQARGYSAWDASTTVNQGTHIRWNVLGNGESHFVNHKGLGTAAGGIYFDETDTTGDTIVPLGCMTGTWTSHEHNLALDNTFNAATQASRYSIFLGNDAGKFVNEDNATYVGAKILIGPGAGYLGTSHTGSVVIGQNAGRGVGATTGGSYNILIGPTTGYSITTASYCTCIGSGAASSMSACAYNTSIGSGSAPNLLTGSNNTFLGGGAGKTCATGTYNVCIGYNSETTAAADYGICIGYQFSVGTRSIGIGCNESVSDYNTLVGYSGTTIAKHYASSHFDIYKDASNYFQFYQDTTAPFINHAVAARTSSTTNFLRSYDSSLVDGDRYNLIIGKSSSAGRAGNLEMVLGTTGASYSDSYVALSIAGNADILKAGNDNHTRCKGNLYAVNVIGSTSVQCTTAGGLTVGSYTPTNTQWSYVAGMNQGVSTGSSPSFSGISASSTTFGGYGISNWSTLSGINQGLSTGSSPSFSGLSAGSTTFGGYSITGTNWSTLQSLNQGLSTSSSPTFYDCTASNMLRAYGIGSSGGMSSVGGAQFGACTVVDLGTGIVYSSTGRLTSSDPSDFRWKKDIIPLESMLSKVLALKPVRFTWKDTEQSTIGFIAQELEEELPELVKLSLRPIPNVKDEMGIAATEEGKGILTDKLIPIAIQAIKELNAKLDAALARITELETQLKNH